MASPPSGTVTFLFTDIEGSTRLWQQQPDTMRAAVARHDALLRRAIEAHDGFIVKTTGDGVLAAFATALAALAACLAAQRAVLTESWGETPIRVRMGMHTGTAEERDGDYFGPALNRAARLMAAGHGGQILLSLATQELVRDSLPPQVALRDLGERRLKDLIRPERVFQVLAPDLPQDFPPLKTLDARPNNLPVQLTSFVGREREMQAIKAALAKTRLLTLTGSGGAGKTRLALQVAADRVDDFAHGVWLVELAALSDARLVPQAVATVLDVQEEARRPLVGTLAAYLKERELLIVLDNCEHLVEACARLADTLLRAAPGLKIVATSREGLNVAGETVYRVP
ncbi:MAG: adenylate/guanylate cyclase domain-containing protein, partial [Chloroflexi bacterium]|nr:adenylate/guanylate cyclase domain-containing protein [Chloroflexota bacterium]